MKATQSGTWFCGLIAGVMLSTHVYAIGPANRVVPHRPNPPGPNNPIGPNNPAVSNPLSSLNPAAPFSNNQIILRQLMLPMQKTALPNSANPNATNTLYGYIPNASLPITLKNRAEILHGNQLLLNNRSVYSTSHPLVFKQPDPMTPLSNSYKVINGRYYAISHDPANDVSMYDTGATLFNGSQMIYIGLGQELRFAIQTGVQSTDMLPPNSGDGLHPGQ